MKFTSLVHTKEITMQPKEITMQLLYKKIFEVQHSVGVVAKKGRNEFHKYDYATEADVLAVLRPALKKAGLAITSSVTARETKPVTDAKGAPAYFTIVDVSYTIFDVENGEHTTVLATGTGIDSGDKGLYKALTGASKYFLLKTFLLPTGDDPEKDSGMDALAKWKFAKKDKTARAIEKNMDAEDKIINSPDFDI